MLLRLTQTASMPLQTSERRPQEITTGITNPAVTRSVTITGNVSGIDGVVEIDGLNDFDEVISEELTANGVSTVESTKAYKEVTKIISLPIQDHTPAAQTETKQVTHAATSAGTITLTLTAAGYAGDAVEVELELGDTVSEVAGKIADGTQCAGTNSRKCLRHRSPERAADTVDTDSSRARGKRQHSVAGFCGYRHHRSHDGRIHQRDGGRALRQN